MSVFSKIKFAKKAAKEHKVAAAQKGSDGNDVKAPYKHVPTHAAVDALSGAPSSWKHEDRPKIKEHHKRRSQMVISRTTSSLSTFSHGTGVGVGSSSQAPPMLRNSSYSSYNPTWFDRGDQSYLNEPIQKRYKVTRGHSYNDSGIGPSIGSSPLVSNMNSNVNSEGTSSATLFQPHPLSQSTSETLQETSTRLISNPEVSPVISSGNSTSSNSSSQNLEMPTMPTKPNRQSQRLQPMVYAEKDIFQRLHTSTTRKIGEAPLCDSPPVPVVVNNPMTTADVVAQEQKQKRQRWSLRGKRNTATIAV
jgi:hypothetical protein